MALYVLDTDHLTLLQSAYPRVSARYLHESNAGNVAVSVASYEEQVRGRLAFLSQAKTLTVKLEDTFGYAKLSSSIAGSASWTLTIKRSGFIKACALCIAEPARWI